MRALKLVLFSVVIAACGGSGGGDDDDTTPPDGNDNPPPERGFRITSPDIEIGPNVEVTKCFYFRTSNTEALAINDWVADMTPGSHHMIMFLTNGDLMPPGTIEENCGFASGSGTNLPIWTFASQTPHAEVTLPVDDGAGKPLAQEVPANSAGFLQMHYFNATDQTITAHVQVDAKALDAGAAFTKTAAYVTFNGSINIPPMTNNVVASFTCNTPADAKFWLLSTHAHKQATNTAVKDVSSTVFESADWEHPGAATFMTPDTFYTFSTNKLTYECTYSNPTNRTITTGDSAATDEMCMATGYYFPATGPKFCYNNISI